MSPPYILALTARRSACQTGRRGGNGCRTGVQTAQGILPVFIIGHARRVELTGSQRRRALSPVRQFRQTYFWQSLPLCNYMNRNREAICNDCGHRWYPRSTTSQKPNKCSACSSRNVAWVDTLEQNTNTQTQYQQPFAQPVEAAPEPQVFYEPRQSAPTRNPTTADLKQAVREAVKECVREEVSAASAPTYQAPPQYYPPQYYPPTMDDAEREELEALRDEQDRQTRVEERIRDFCGDDTEVIHNPDYVNSNDKEIRVGWIDYDTGRPRAAIAVSEERYHKLLDVEEKEKAAECGKESVKDIAKLSRGGKMAVKEGEAMKLSPEEQRGVSGKALATVALLGLGAFITFAVIIPAIKNHVGKKQAEEEVKETSAAGNPRYVPLYSNKVKGGY